MNITGLFETHLAVTDLDRSVAFYRDIVGLPLAYTQPERGVTFLWIGAPGRAMLGLWQSNPVLRLHLHLAFSLPLDDLLAAPTNLRQAGVIPRGFGGRDDDEPLVYGWMPAVAVFFDDPDGHSLEFISMLPGPSRPDLGSVAWSDWQKLVSGSGVHERV